MSHQCYGKRDVKYSACKKHGFYVYYNYMRKCPKCLEENGCCGQCGKILNKEEIGEDNGKTS